MKLHVHVHVRQQKTPCFELLLSTDESSTGYTATENASSYELKWQRCEWCSMFVVWRLWFWWRINSATGSTMSTTARRQKPFCVTYWKTSMDFTDRKVSLYDSCMINIENTKFLALYAAWSFHDAEKRLKSLMTFQTTLGALRIGHHIFTWTNWRAT